MRLDQSVAKLQAEVDRHANYSAAIIDNGDSQIQTKQRMLLQSIIVLDSKQETNVSSISDLLHLLQQLQFPEKPHETTFKIVDSSMIMSSLPTTWHSSHGLITGRKFNTAHFDSSSRVIVSYGETFLTCKLTSLPPFSLHNICPTPFVA
jgi:hypothetical protein